MRTAVVPETVGRATRRVSSAQPRALCAVGGSRRLTGDVVSIPPARSETRLTDPARRLRRSAGLNPPDHSQPRFPLFDKEFRMAFRKSRKKPKPAVAATKPYVATDRLRAPTLARSRMEVLIKRKRTRQPSLDINTWKFPPLRLEIGEETLAELTKGYNKTPEERAQIRVDNARFFAEFEKIAQTTRSRA
jgi:hypothetical protein